MFMILYKNELDARFFFEKVYSITKELP